MSARTNAPEDLDMTRIRMRVKGVVWSSVGCLRSSSVRLPSYRGLPLTGDSQAGEASRWNWQNRPLI